MTRKGIEAAVPAWMKRARDNLRVVSHELEMLADERLAMASMMARPAFDAVFFSAMAWCLTPGIPVVQRKSLPESVERHLIEPGALDPAFRNPVRRLAEAWRHEVDWRPRRKTPTPDDARRWTETARKVHALAMDAVAAAGVELEDRDDTDTGTGTATSP